MGTVLVGMTMSQDGLIFASTTQLAAAIRAGGISAVEAPMA
jgi:hypothetical protein